MGKVTARVDVARIGRDPDAFEAFYREHVDAVERFVARRVRDAHLVADLTTDVFLAAIDSAHRYRPRRAEPIAWLYGVARNVVAAEFRRSERERRATTRVASGRSLVDDDDLARLEERIDAESRARGLHDAMARLPDGERAVLELVAVDGLAVGEAAQALGIRAVAARVRLHRARRSLREQLDPAADIGTHLTEASS